MVPRKEEAPRNLQCQQTQEVQRESVGGSDETGQKWMIRLVKHNGGKSEQQEKKRQLELFTNMLLVACVKTGLVRRSG